MADGADDDVVNREYSDGKAMNGLEDSMIQRRSGFSPQVAPHFGAPLDGVRPGSTHASGDR